MLQRHCIKCIRPWAFYKNEYSSTRSKQSCFWASYILAVLSQLTFFSYHYIIHILYSEVDVKKLGKKLLSHWHSSNCIIQNKTNMNVTYLEFIRSTECTLVPRFKPIRSTSMSIHQDYEPYRHLLFFPKNITSSNPVMVRRFVKQTFKKQHYFTLNIPLYWKFFGSDTVYQKNFKVNTASGNCGATLKQN